MAVRNTPMTERELVAIINRQIEDCSLYEGDQKTGLAVRRTKALRYYEGEESLGGDVPVQPGRSAIVSRDVADTHGWILPSLLRVFLSADRVAEYQPRRRGTEEQAEQATDYINYLFFSECNGYRVVHSGLWDALLFGNGIFKHWWDPTPEYKFEDLSGKTELDYHDLLNDPNVEILEHTARPDFSFSESSPPGVSGPLAAGNAGMDSGTAGADGGAETLPGEPGIPAPPGAAGDGGPGEGTGDPPPGGLAPGGVAGGPGLPAGFASGADIGEAGNPFGGFSPQLHDLKIRRTLSNGRLRLVAVPREEFRIDRNAIMLDEEHVRFAAHVCKRTRSDLVAEGYDRDIVDELPATTILTPEDIGRNRIWSGDNAPDRSTELIDVWECYLQIDYDGDGVAEWRRVITAAGASEHTILLNEEWGDNLPFTDILTDPFPHQWQGGSLYDELADIQRIKTLFLRGVVDNIRWVNNPMMQVPENGILASSKDQFLNPEHGAVIYTRGNAVIQPLEIPFIADKLSFGLDMADKIREFRTGVSSSTMALDPQALVNQTATAVNAGLTASYSKIESYARNIAEGLRRLFRESLRLVCKHQDQEKEIRLRGEWVKMDPRGWDSDMDVSVSVGLGSGSRDRDMSVLGVIIQKMEQVIQTLGLPAAAALDMGPDRLFDAYRKFIESGGIHAPESFFPDISKDQVQALVQMLGQQQQQGDPKAAESAARVQLIGAQIDQVKAQTAALGLKAQGDMAGAQTDAQKAVYEQQHQLAQIENLRAAAMANMAKAGATQSDAQINAELAHLEALDRLAAVHQNQQQINIDAHQNQQKINNDAVDKMLRRVQTPGVN